ncbi:MerR family transcriptional regulator [Clavibacter michiganensis]|uniref:MerR family transcriptional regulator n=1 Tax=Clavibacter michiganensis TaxID=28447 RepID=UPI0021578051|nr:MerR family transcriptional regulator [Clavibacter michiganensis]
MKGKSARRSAPRREEGGMLRIGDVAGRAGVSTRALRYYEEQGLLPAERTPSGQRIYAEAAVERVRLIQRLYAAGLPSRTILALLPSVDTGVAAPGTMELLRAERDRISAGIAELERAREELSRVIEICRHPTPEHCPALRDGAAADAGTRAEHVAA